MGGEALRARIAQLEPEAYWTKLVTDMAGGATVCCSMSGGVEALHPMGIMSGHAYGVLNVCEIEVGGTTERLMHIRNPWGGGAEWTGAWSDNDPRWMSAMTAEQREQLEYVRAKRSGATRPRAPRTRPRTRPPARPTTHNHPTTQPPTSRPRSSATDRLANRPRPHASPRAPLNPHNRVLTPAGTGMRRTGRGG